MGTNFERRWGYERPLAEVEVTYAGTTDRLMVEAVYPEAAWTRIDSLQSDDHRQLIAQ